MDSQRDEAAVEDIWFRANRQPGTLRVYAAYDTGLARGTSVKLHVTPKTTSREVANLVVYVVSPQASATTGAALRVDGGVVETIA